MPNVIASWYSELVQRDEPAAQPARRDLGRVQRRGHRGDPDAEAEHQASSHQHAGPGCQRLDDCAHAEQQRRHEDRPAAPQPLGHVAGDDRAHQGAERHPAGDDLEQEGADLERLLDAVERTADDALVIAEQQPGQHDHDGNQRHPKAQSLPCGDRGCGAGSHWSPCGKNGHVGRGRRQHRSETVTADDPQRVKWPRSCRPARLLVPRRPTARSCGGPTAGRGGRRAG